MGQTKVISMHAIKHAYEANPTEGEGRHWFSPSSMRFFSTRLPRSGFAGPGGTFFVTSERRESFGEFPGGERMFTVRCLRGPGDIVTIGEFHSYPTRGTATREAKRLAEGAGNRAGTLAAKA